MNFKEIHIGSLIQQRVTESGTAISRICNFMKCTQEEIEDIYKSKSIDIEKLLKLSKLLEYDFFRLYTQHLIFYAPPVSSLNVKAEKKSSLPQFRKNIYTKEIIDFILKQIESGKMTKNEVIGRYNIPKTTLYKWISKYKTSKIPE